MKAKSLACNMGKNDNKSCWRDIKLCQKNKFVPPVAVGGARGNADILHMWVKYNKSVFAFIEVISSLSFCEDMYVTGEEMDKIISSLKAGKSAGHDDIQAEHLPYAGSTFIDPLCKLMIAILVLAICLME